MIQRIIVKANKKKTFICMILAVFFCAFTISLHIPDIMNAREFSLFEEGHHKTASEHAENMASNMENNDLLFDSIIIMVMRTSNSQYLFQASYLNKSAAPILKFALFWSVLFAIVGLMIKFLYMVNKETSIIHKLNLYTVLSFLHNSDGKKSVCFSN